MRVLRRGTNFARVRFTAAGLRERADSALTLAVPLNPKVLRQGADFNCRNVCDTVI
jgi:hypothetical protein